MKVLYYIFPLELELEIKNRLAYFPTIVGIKGTGSYFVKDLIGQKLSCFDLMNVDFKINKYKNKFYNRQGNYFKDLFRFYRLKYINFISIKNRKKARMEMNKFLEVFYIDILKL